MSGAFIDGMRNGSAHRVDEVKKMRDRLGWEKKKERPVILYRNMQEVHKAGQGGNE